jgi:hypothetical protein
LHSCCFWQEKSAKEIKTYFSLEIVIAIEIEIDF